MKVNEPPARAVSSLKMPLLVLVLLILGVGVAANLITMGIWMAGNLPMDTIHGEEVMSLHQRILLRLGLGINHMGMFLIPACIWLYIFQRSAYAEFLRLRLSTWSKVTLWGFVILCSYPLIAFLTQVNMSLPLPDWMTSSNEAQLNLLSNTLYMQGIGELAMNMVLVALLAAVGEELIFRGIIQRCLQLRGYNMHIAIVVTALFFGVFHMQFERFIPLAFLGILLGYAYHYTDSLWTVIILHFVNNGLQVLILFATRDEQLPEVDSIPDIPWVVTLGSLLATTVLFYVALRKSKSNDEPRFT